MRNGMPKKLSPEAKRLWKTTVDTWTLDGPGFVLLENACRCLDRLRAAEKVLANKGVTFLDRFGSPRPHPAMSIVRDENTTFVRILEQLGLDVAGAAAKARPVEDDL
jgi:phage terminase small subunit